MDLQIDLGVDLSKIFRKFTGDKLKEKLDSLTQKHPLIKQLTSNLPHLKINEKFLIAEPGRCQNGFWEIQCKSSIEFYEP